MFTLHRSLTHTAALAFLLGTTALALPAYAADTALTQPPSAPSEVRQMKMDLAGKMEKRVDVRIKTLHDELKITKEQDAGWEPVAQSMRDNETTVAKLIEDRKANTGNMTAIDDVKSYQTIAQAHADGLSKFVTVFEPFYNSLTDTQKKAADAFFSKSQKHGHKHGASKAAPVTSGTSQ